MFIGDKIKLVKPFGSFTDVGDICEVVFIMKGVITFETSHKLLGCMTYKEYEEFFEPVNITRAREWSNWEHYCLPIYNVEGIKQTMIVSYRENSKSVQARCFNGRKYIYGVSRCHDTDAFDLNKGLKLAEKRMLVNLFSDAVEHMAKSM